MRSFVVAALVVFVVSACNAKDPPVCPSEQEREFSSSLSFLELDYARLAAVLDNVNNTTCDTNRQQIEPLTTVIEDMLDVMESQERFERATIECRASWRQRFAMRMRGVIAKHQERVERATRDLPKRCGDPRMKSAFERATRVIERLQQKVKV